MAEWKVPDVICGGYWDTLSVSMAFTISRKLGLILSRTKGVRERLGNGNESAWDFGTSACQPCSWDPSQPPPVDAPKQDLETGFTKSMFARALGSFTSKPKRQLNALEKRVGECSAFRRPDGVVIYMPNVPDAWAANPQGPTADTIANTPQVQDAFQAAWDDSFPVAGTAQEMKLTAIDRWIYADPTDARRIFIRRADRSRSTPLSQNATPGSGTAAIDLNNPESNPGQPAPAGDPQPAQ
ncbi:hypothetical protein DXG01_005590 [Tephrocybe rancida]|nr:hypothetical protein DXG01_005590 [Tephrocybe rancida]